MIRRSKSVSKVADEELAKRYPKTFQPVLENKIKKCYKQNSSTSKPKFLYIPLAENSNMIHLHRNKSFEKMTKTSPHTRISKLQDSSISSQRQNTGRLVRTGTEKSFHRQEKSKELLMQAEKIVAIHKENNEEIKKTAKNFHQQIRENMKGINKRLSIEGLPSIELSKKIFNKRKLQLPHRN